jgi:hypothetical protein
MRQQQINSVSGVALVGVSLIALLTVLSGYAAPAQFSQPDEGTGAHIFQLSLVALLPIVFLFLSTADWAQPSRSARLLVVAGVIVALAFAALYYGEHYYR